VKFHALAVSVPEVALAAVIRVPVVPVVHDHRLSVTATVAPPDGHQNQ
jgi:hypothetical protein